MANFTGTLLRRRHELGEKFVQLVFRDNDHDVVCVSTNLRTATLPVGEPYHVEGTFTYKGERAFVLDPKIADPKKHGRPLWRAAFACFVLVCAAGIGSIMYLQRGTPVSSQQSSSFAPAASTGPKVSTY